MSESWIDRLLEKQKSLQVENQKLKNALRVIHSTAIDGENALCGIRNTKHAAGYFQDIQKYSEVTDE